MEWQPIETAPRDGTTVLLFWPDACLNDQVEAGSYIHTSDGMRWVNHSDSYDFEEPTHWMPLPPPPVNVENKPIDTEQTK